MFSINIDVRYKETDAQGVVHHSNYIVWFEEARMKYLKHLGVSYKNMEDSGIFFVLREIDIKYLYPIKFEDNVNI